jgi:hypothetical protein
MIVIEKNTKQTLFLESPLLHFFKKKPILNRSDGIPSNNYDRQKPPNRFLKQITYAK